MTGNDSESRRHRDRVDDAQHRTGDRTDGPPRRRGGDRFHSDDRAVAPQISYVLSMTIAALLVGGIVTTMGGVVTDQEQRVTETELQVAGTRLAAEMMAVDRLAQRDSDITVSLDPDVPVRAGGAQYRVRVETGPAPGDDALVLILPAVSPSRISALRSAEYLEIVTADSMTDAEGKVTVWVPMTVETAVANDEITSGELYIVRRSGVIDLERRPIA